MIFEPRGVNPRLSRMATEAPQTSETSAPVRRRYSVSVREFVDWALKSGNLASQRRFTPPNRALQGVEEHKRVQDTRPPEYISETPVRFSRADAGIELTLQGRIDGLWPQPEGWLLEEIKSVTPDWDGTPHPLHWAQAKVYAFLFLQDNPIDEIRVQLTYSSIETHALTVFREKHTAAQLEEFFNALWTANHARYQKRAAWSASRDTSLASLPFPFPALRPGQQALIDAVAETTSNGGRLFAEAPTGIGKTISVLFGALPGLANAAYDRLYYLTAKTSGRRVAEEAIESLRSRGARLRSLTLNAAEATCFTEATRCNLQTCPYAIGYFDRYRGAIDDALKEQRWDFEFIRRLGEKRSVCPFALARDLIPEADIIIGDFNHAFDPNATVSQLASPENCDKAALLVDEAHNLVDRSRSMFSAQLQESDFTKLSSESTATSKPMDKSLRRIAKEFESLQKGGDEGHQDFRLETIPATLSRSLNDLSAIIEAWMPRNESHPMADHLTDLYFKILDFKRACDRRDSRYRILVTHSDRRKTIHVLCLDPSKELASIQKRIGPAIFFSATLTPAHYFKTLLGGMEPDPEITLASPFSETQMRLFVHDRVDTRWRARDASLGQVVDSIRKLVRIRPGGHLVFLPSYDYLDNVFAAFQEVEPNVTSRRQTRGMALAERQAFLDTFVDDPKRPHVAFATLGGVFGEGVDLVGTRLVGVTVVSVGFPQVGLERNLLRDYFEERLGAGFDFAYRFPGMNRVIQAVGRLIRSPDDQGVALLLDARFAEPEYRALFPSWWRPIWASAS